MSEKQFMYCEIVKIITGYYSSGGFQKSPALDCGTFSCYREYDETLETDIKSALPIGYDVFIESLDWTDIAILLAARMRRKGIEIDGACVEEDGYMWFWLGEKPWSGEGYGTWELSQGTKMIQHSSTSDPIGVYVDIPEGADWKNMIIVFEKGGNK